MIKSFFTMLWSLIVVVYKAGEVAVLGVVFGSIWLIRFTYMFVFMIVGVLCRYAWFGFLQGWRLPKLEVNDVSK